MDCETSNFTRNTLKYFPALILDMTKVLLARTKNSPAHRSGAAKIHREEAETPAGLHARSPGRTGSKLGTAATLRRRSTTLAVFRSYQSAGLQPGHGETARGRPSSSTTVSTSERVRSRVDRRSMPERRHISAELDLANPGPPAAAGAQPGQSYNAPSEPSFRSRPSDELPGAR